MAQYTQINKNCGTCDYWGGQREIDRGGQRVFINSPMDKGKCMCQSSGHASNPGKQAVGSCSSYRKWCALR